jgi:hypothetical protein
MAIFLGLLCSLASLVLMGGVALMNFRFMTRLGTSELDGLVLGVGSIAIDVMLALMGALVIWGFLNGRRLYAWGLIGIGAIFAALSFASALGFAAEGRDGMIAGRQTERLAVEAAERRLAGLQAARTQLGTLTAASVVEVRVNALRADQRWPMTRQCTVARQKEWADWCNEAHKAMADLAKAKAAERLDAEIPSATTELLSLRRKTGRSLVDAQVALIVEMTGWSEAKVRVSLVLLAITALQMGAGFGLGIGLAPLLVFLEERRRRRVSKPQFGEHLRWKQGTEGAPEVEDDARSLRRAGKKPADDEDGRPQAKASGRRLN